MATPIGYESNDGGDQQIAASLIAIQFANSTSTITLGDTPAIPLSIVTSNTIGTNVYLTNYAVDEDYNELPTSYTIQIADSFSTITIGDTPAIPLSILSTNTSSTNYALDEDYSEQSASFNFLVATTYVRTAKESELPQGEGGPTTVQIWRTG